MKVLSTAASGIAGTHAASRPGPLPLRARWLLVVACVLVALGASFYASGLDRSLMLAAHAQPASAFGVFFWSALTVLGLGWSAVILVLALDRGDGRLSAMLLPLFVIGSLLTHVPKRLFAHPRPAATDIAGQLHVIGQAFTGAVSMPSGHAVTAGATAGLIALVLAGRGPRGWLAAAAVLLVGLLVALSRVIVGAHWPSDITVGFGLGFLSLAAALRLATWARSRGAYERFARAVASRSGQRWIGALEVLAAVGLLREHTGYPAAHPVVVLLAAVAVVSALWRWYASRPSRAAAAATEAPAEPT